MRAVSSYYLVRVCSHEFDSTGSAPAVANGISAQQQHGAFVTKRGAVAVPAPVAAGAAGGEDNDSSSSSSSLSISLSSSLTMVKS
jgi:hypothetical protein